MTRRGRLARFAWAAGLGAVLVAKSALPLLAALAAGLQGLPLVEVCAVYGVATLPLAGPATAAEGHLVERPAGHHHGAGLGDPAFVAAHANDGEVATRTDQPPGHGRHAEHRSDHCALSALATLAFGLATTVPAPTAVGTFVDRRATSGGRAVGPDAPLRWLHLQLHAPPAAA